MSLYSNEHEAIENTLADDSDSVLESVAEKQSVRASDVIECLPDDEVSIISGVYFDRVMTEITEWGDVTVIVHTADLVFEAHGSIPPGSIGQSKNMHGRTIEGDLNASGCKTIVFVSRLLFGRKSYSVQFYNADGDCMFKVYLGRDEQGSIINRQLRGFRKLAEALQVSPDIST